MCVVLLAMMRPQLNIWVLTSKMPSAQASFGSLSWGRPKAVQSPSCVEFSSMRRYIGGTTARTLLTLSRDVVREGGAKPAGSNISVKKSVHDRLACLNRRHHPRRKTRCPTSRLFSLVHVVPFALFRLPVSIPELRCPLTQYLLLLQKHVHVLPPPISVLDPSAFTSCLSPSTLENEGARAAGAHEQSLPSRARYLAHGRYLDNLCVHVIILLIVPQVTNVASSAGEETLRRYIKYIHHSHRLQPATRSIILCTRRNEQSGVIVHLPRIPCLSSVDSFTSQPISKWSLAPYTNGGFTHQET